MYRSVRQTVPRLFFGTAKRNSRPHRLQQECGERCGLEPGGRVLRLPARDDCGRIFHQRNWNQVSRLCGKYVPAQLPGMPSRAPSLILVCHPERSDCFAKRSSREVEGPLYLNRQSGGVGLMCARSKNPARASEVSSSRSFDSIRPFATNGQTPLRMTPRWGPGSRTTTSHGPERIFQRRTLRREQLGAAFGNVHVIFKTHAEFARHVDSRLVAESHVACEQCGVAAHQVGPFVDVHSDSVSQAVSEEFVVWPIARVTDHLPRRRIHRLTFHAGSGRLQRGSLSTMHDLKNFLHLVRRLAEDECAGDIGLIALDGATIIQHDEPAFANHLWDG